jgi:hypothetical protein
LLDLSSLLGGRGLQSSFGKVTKEGVLIIERKAYGLLNYVAMEDSKRMDRAQRGQGTGKEIFRLSKVNVYECLYDT